MQAPVRPERRSERTHCRVRGQPGCHWNRAFQPAGKSKRSKHIDVRYRAFQPAGESKQSKHIDVRCHYARERAANGDIIFKCLPMEEQLAELATKALHRVRVLALRQRLMQCSVPNPARVTSYSGNLKIF